jgi:hypothetical protein
LNERWVFLSLSALSFDLFPLVDQEHENPDSRKDENEDQNEVSHLVLLSLAYSAIALGDFVHPFIVQMFRVSARSKARQRRAGSPNILTALSHFS